MAKPITDFKRTQVKDFYMEGLSVREIAERSNLSIKTTIRIIAKITHTTRWSKQEIEKLVGRWNSIPRVKFVSSVEFSNLCKELNRSPSSVIRMVNNLGLNELKPGEEFEIDYSDIEANPMKRPPSIYTNSKTPYGIADEIHSGDRTFIEQCKY